MFSDWGAATGTGGSSYDSGNLNYPAVPYGPNDFNGRDKCPTSSGNIENYGASYYTAATFVLNLNDIFV